MKFITFLILFVLVVFALLGYLVKSLFTYQEQVKALQVQVQRLEAPLASAQADLKAAQEKVHELEQSLVTVQAERDQVVAERGAWQARAQQVEQAIREAQAENGRLQARVQELEQALQSAQDQSAADTELGMFFPFQHHLWVVLAPAFLIALVVVGYSGFRFTSKFPPPTQRPMTTQSSHDAVRVCMSRRQIAEYVRWLRQTRANGLTSEVEDTRRVSC
jgi:F0F1-type ATP synthase membrane subunit b/b'